jgi:hypothetical protein
MGYVELAATTAAQTPAAFLARDEFDQTAGALIGKTAPVGGAWAGAGDADDFSVETTGKTAQRTALSDSHALGHQAISGVAAQTNTVVQVDFKYSTALAVAQFQYCGLVARYVDSSNFLAVVLMMQRTTDATFYSINAAPWIAGAFAASLGVRYVSPIVPAAWHSMRAVIDSAGRVLVYLGPQGALSYVFGGYSSLLATGGTLASGKPGFLDAWFQATAQTRNYDNFLAFSPTPDAAMFASQSLALRSDRATREDAGGTLSNDVVSRRGTYLRVRPAGREARSSRFVVKPYRNEPTSMPDPAIDDVSAQLFVTPRGLVVPE